MDWTALETFLLLEKRWSNATVQERCQVLRKAAEAGLDLDNLTLESARAFLVGKLRAGATGNAFNNNAKALKGLLAWRGLDHTVIKLQKQPRSRYKFLSADQVRACLNYRCHPKKREPLRRAILLLGLKTALRTGEVITLDANHFDRSTTPNRLYVAKPTKRGARRWIPVEPWVLSPRRALGAFLASKKPTHSQAVLTDAAGHRLTVKDVRAELQEISRDLGFRVSCTIMRHTRATELRRAGWDLLALQHYLGHANISSTAIYAAVTPDDLQLLMAKKGSKDPWASKGGRPRT